MYKKGKLYRVNEEAERLWFYYPPIRENEGREYKSGDVFLSLGKSPDKAPGNQDVNRFLAPDQRIVETYVQEWEPWLKEVK